MRDKVKNKIAMLKKFLIASGLFSEKDVMDIIASVEMSADSCDEEFLMD